MILRFPASLICGFKLKIFFVGSRRWPWELTALQLQRTHANRQSTVFLNVLRCGVCSLRSCLFACDFLSCSAVSPRGHRRSQTLENHSHGNTWKTRGPKTIKKKLKKKIVLSLRFWYFVSCLFGQIHICRIQLDRRIKYQTFSPSHLHVFPLLWSLEPRPLFNLACVSW